MCLQYYMFFAASFGKSILIKNYNGNREANNII